MNDETKKNGEGAIQECVEKKEAEENKKEKRKKCLAIIVKVSLCIRSVVSNYCRLPLPHID
jgi:hypothetical protein